MPRSGGEKLLEHQQTQRETIDNQMARGIDLGREAATRADLILFISQLRAKARGRKCST